jgi:hypothetical protein
MEYSVVKDNPSIPITMYSRGLESFEDSVCDYQPQSLTPSENSPAD